MSDRYFLNGQPLTLGVLLGEGGEGKVHLGKDRHDHLAIKIWKEAQFPELRKVQIEKVKYAIQVPLPDKIFKPIGIVTNQNGEIVGYAMNKYPSGYIAIDELSLTTTWKNYNLTQQDIVKVVSNIFHLISSMHKLGVIMGDCNPFNFFFNPITFDVIAGDADAYQYSDQLPCFVGYPAYMSPRMFNKDLFTLQHPYKEEDDWWSFIINTFRSLMRVHPFRQGSLDVDSVTDRVLLKLHVLNQGVSYPPLRIANPPLSLPDDTLGFFLAVFDELKISSVPDSFINTLSSALRECPNHSKNRHSYPHVRNECPHCTANRMVPQITAAVVGAQFALNEVFSFSKGSQVLIAESVNINNIAHLIIITRNTNNQLIATYFANKNHQSIILPIGFNPTQQIGVNAKYIVIADQGSIVLIDHQGNLVHSELSSEIYMNRTVVGLTPTEPVWMIGSSMTFGQDFLGQLLPDNSIHHSLAYGIVWFDSSIYAEKIVGFINWLEGYEWFVVDDRTNRDPLDIPFEKGEYLIDWRIIFAPDGFAIARRSRILGSSETVVVDVFDLYNNHLYKEVLPPDISIHSICLARGTILIPTYEGIKRKRDGEDIQLLTGTENVPPDCTIISLERQAVVITDDAIFTLNKS